MALPRLDTPRLPSPRKRAQSLGPIGRFLVPSGTREENTPHQTYPWYHVLWLTGVDYFSTLGYQPGIAFLAAGALSPVATLVLVLVTLGGALPIYSQVASRSYVGQGSIAMLERLLPGWWGKVFVLALLGFAATDFVITMTLSAADAAQHAVENPFLKETLGAHQMLVTCVLLCALAAVFLRGFQEAVRFAAVICIPYLVVNAIVIVRGCLELVSHPVLLEGWKVALSARGDTGALALAALLVFPRLALGMSGFETGVAMMPLVRGLPGNPVPPRVRIRGTRLLLLTAALVMSVFLLSSSLLTTLLVPSTAMVPGGVASGRALSWLAHELLGEAFGTVYDASTIAILWFAGASAMAGMLNLIPRYLPRFGMAPRWLEHRRPLVLILLGVDLVVTWVFRAGVEAQGGAYATGVLALMLSAAVAVAISFAKEGGRRLASAFFWLVTAVFAYTLVDNVIERPDGVIISSIFILTVLVVSAASRIRRATELRVETLTFADEESRLLWEAMRGKRVNVVPVRTSDPPRRAAKSRLLRRHYRAEGPLAFLHVELADDRSQFTGSLRATVRRSGEDFLIEIEGAVAIANAIAWISEQIDPIALYLDLSLANPFTQALKFLLFGEGETGVLVFQILVRYWHTTSEDDVRPNIFLVSR
ncbi:MAG: amino acid transporter [Myxococcales bacterium]